MEEDLQPDHLNSYPPSHLVLLFQIEESHHVFQKILHDLEILSETPGGTVTPEHQTLFELIVSHRPSPSQVLVFVFVLIFFTLSTSSVVYTVASGLHWQRAVVRSVRVAIIWVIVILHLAGLVYLSVVWQFASVVTVLEGSYGVFVRDGGHERMEAVQFRLDGENSMSDSEFLVVLSFGPVDACYANRAVFCLQVLPPRDCILTCTLALSDHREVYQRYQVL
ncbi:hypothetical protein E2542_SST03952 [Spatholobus suberectus]|nr:hypothetical protein E2542_SST03952 [Spatholobus suberectus]